MLDTSNLETGRPIDKLTPRQEEPFKVLKVSSHAVTLELPINIKVFNMFYIGLVRLWKGNGVLGQSQIEQDVRANQGRTIVRTDGHEDKPIVEQEFKKILDYGQANNGRWHYLVKWKAPHELSWQKVSDFKGCDDAIQDFYDSYLNHPPPPLWVPWRRQRG